MKPLIITATPNISWLHPEVKYPKTPETMAREAKRCEEAGASIIHVHAEKWEETIQAVRSECKAILQCGMSSLPISERMEVFNEGADMISVMLSHHDEAFVDLDTHQLHPREELEEYMKLCSRHNVKPEFEVWHTGSIWNLNFLAKKRLVSRPYFTTLFLGWPGGNWTPPTPEEYLYRRKIMPEDSIVSVSVMGKEQSKVLKAAIERGDHVRVGTEDNPFIGNKPATTPQLVAWIAETAERLGRSIASTSEAAEMMKLRR